MKHLYEPFNEVPFSWPSYIGYCVGVCMAALVIACLWGVIEVPFSWPSYIGYCVGVCMAALVIACLWGVI